MQYRYLTNTPGIGGRIKKNYEDFIVEEIGVNYKTKLTYLPDKKVYVDWKKIFEEKPEDKDYLYVDMEKSNVSTTTAIKRLSRFIHTSKKRINYAGLKDKRAISVQKISIYKPDYNRISKFYFKNIKIYNPEWKEDHINIGDLKQNNFKISIKDITGFSKKDLENIFSNFKKQIEEKGVINYFGEQRFGGLRDITHKVGKLILKREYKKAVILYLTKTFDLEREEISKARKALREDLNFKKHAANFPIRTGYETAIINYLANNEGDYLGAFKKLPKSIQYLFVHAYQSYIFNKIINKRIEYGYSTSKIDGDNIIDNKIQIPLFGYESKISPHIAGDIEREVLNEENISLFEFKNRDHSVFSSKGSYRPFLSKVYNLNLLDIKKEEDNTLSLSFEFTLDKGQYATNVVRELIKPTTKAWY
jgi:tRNA pseudouridine13 synthase